MIESLITGTGQTTLPKAVREALGVQAGDRIRYFIADGEVRIFPVRSIKRLFGALQHGGPTVSVKEMERAVADGAAEEHLDILLP